MSGSTAGDTAGDWEDVRAYVLGSEAERELLERQTECTFVWLGKGGHPIGVIMNFMWRRDSLWLTATEQRPRVGAVRRDPRVSVAISSRGSGIEVSQSLTYTGLCTVHDDEATRRWFIDEFSHVVRPDSQEKAAAFAAHLDSPGRVFLQVMPHKRIGFDGDAMWKAAPSAAPTGHRGGL